MADNTNPTDPNAVDPNVTDPTNENVDNNTGEGGSNEGGSEEAATAKLKANPLNAWGFEEGKKFIPQTEQREAEWVDDAKSDAKFVVTAQESFKGKEAPTTQLFNVCAIKCPEC